MATRIAGTTLVLAALVLGCAKESSDEALPALGPTTITTADDAELDVPATGEAPDPKPPPADFPADGLEIETLVEGVGRGAVEGDTVTVHYVAVLADGSVFDESWTRGAPFPVTLGEGTVITGFEEGLLGAKVGERRRLVIGSDKAYGDEGFGQIPPGAPMVFEVDVLAIDGG